LEEMKVRAAALVPTIREMLRASRGPSGAEVRALAETMQWEGVDAEDDEMDDDEADWYTEDLDARAEAMVPIIWEMLQAKGRVSQAEVLELAEKMACEEDERRKLEDRAEAMVPIVWEMLHAKGRVSEEEVRALAAKMAMEEEARNAGKGKGKGKAKVENEENISEQEAYMRKLFLETSAKYAEDFRLKMLQGPSDAEIRGMEMEEAELDDEEDEEEDYEL
jgi:hypothetical protein